MRNRPSEEAGDAEGVRLVQGDSADKEGAIVSLRRIPSNHEFGPASEEVIRRAAEFHVATAGRRFRTSVACSKAWASCSTPKSSR